MSFPSWKSKKRASPFFLPTLSNLPFQCRWWWMPWWAPSPPSWMCCWCVSSSGWFSASWELTYLRGSTTTALMRLLKSDLKLTLSTIKLIVKSSWRGTIQKSDGRMWRSTSITLGQDIWRCFRWWVWLFLLSHEVQVGSRNLTWFLLSPGSRIKVIANKSHGNVSFPQTSSGETPSLSTRTSPRPHSKETPHCSDADSRFLQHNEVAEWSLSPSRTEYIVKGK